MKRYNIFFAFVLIFLVSCAHDELGFGGNGISSKNGFQIIGAAEDFDVKTVGTRADGDDIADSYISEMTMFIFKADGSLVQGYSDSGLNTKCSSAINIQKGNPTFLVDTEDGILASLDGSDQTVVYYDNNANDLGQCKIYIVANAWHQLQSELDNITTLTALEEFTLDIDATLAMPKKDDGHYRGFPMIGTHSDDVNFKLKKGESNTHSVATIPLKKLYTKVRFTMQVNAAQLVSGQIPKFQIEKAEVFNIPKKVRMGRGLDSNGKPVYTSTDSDDYITEVADGTVSDANMNTYYQFTGNAPFVITDFKDNRKTIEHTLSATPSENFLIEFGFYMPEHKVTPNTINYPPGIDDDSKQRFKPEGVGVVRNGDGSISAAKIASFVRIHGTYTDHNGQIKTAIYDVYLGQNNSDDFTVKRNQLLTNKLIIIGLTNYHDPYHGAEGIISIDHRVDIEDKGFNLSMERTAILDAHFEVRPLDIELSPGSTMTITIPEGNRSWLAMESDAVARSSGDNNLYVNTTTDRKGVRKYFTTNLVSELTNSNGGTLTVSHSNSENKTEIHRVWFYVDENVNVYDKTGATAPNGDGSYTVSDEMYRVGNVNFAYTGKVDQETGLIPTHSVTIKFQQWNLWRVWNSEGTRYYDIEHEEEYLNNYASDQVYGQTQDGMPWGLDGIQISKSRKAAYINANEGFLGWLINLLGGNYDTWINNMIETSGLAPFYDFYLERDERPENVGYRNFSGRTFNQEIITTLNQLYASYTDTNKKKQVQVDGLTLIDDPQSAIAYCYHKNKRNNSGNVVTANWYLPAIDEIEEISIGAYDEFDKVFQSQKYWSCQPAAYNKTLRLERERWVIVQLSDEVQTGQYMDDNLNRARATSVEYAPTNSNANEDGYVNISSGVDGIEGTWTLHFTQTGTFVNDESGYSKNTGTNQTNYSNHLGNLSRSENARIRAVYRSGTK